MRYLVVLAILIYGCAAVDGVNNNNSQYERVTSGKAEFDLFKPDHSDSTTIQLEYSYYTDIDSVYKDSVNSLIGDFTVRLTEDFSENMSFGKSSLSHDFFIAQLDSFSECYRSEDGNYHLWDLNGEVGIYNERKDFVQVSLSGWLYTGGAHGNGSTTYVLVNKTNGSVLELTDFITSVEELNRIAEIEFRKLYDIPSGQSINDAGFWFENDQFSVNENFSFSGSTMDFLYNSYEIAPYAGGQTLLEVPLDKIKHILRQNL